MERRLGDYEMVIRGRTYVPLISGGMGVDISTAELGLELARLGAVGHISDAMGPFLADKYLKTKFQAEKFKRFRGSQDTLDKTGVRWEEEEVYLSQKGAVSRVMEKKRGEGGVFINVMEKLTMGAPKETLRGRLRGAMDAGIDGITLSAGLHLNSMTLVADNPRFRDVAFGIIVSSARALKLFLKQCVKLDRMPDYVIVEGPLAGGHLGFGQDWAEPQYQLPVLVADTLAFLKEQGLSIPVIPAGGVFTGREAVSYLETGASGVQVATRFTISQECGLPEDVKQHYLRSQESDVVVNMTSPTGYPMRMLKSSPSLLLKIKPQCESLGYILDGKGFCQYHEAYDTAMKSGGIPEKMCICYAFMKYDCYTCGHYVFRLRDTTTMLPTGDFLLPTAEEIFTDYTKNMSNEFLKPTGIPSEEKIILAA